MKIQPIMNVPTNTNLELQRGKAQSFKGLWGETDVNEYEDSTLSMTTRTMHYYPFKDETKSEIDRVVKQNESDGTKSPDSAAVMTFINTTVVSVMAALPFTKREFQDFMSNGLNSLKRKVIENHIIEKNLRI